MMVTTDPNIATAKTWAGFYRARGLNPLPSRTDAKRPLIRFREFWETPIPADTFDRHPTTNIQVMTGRRWRLLVIDLDGPEARERFQAMGPTPRTWETHSGGGGVHLWFTIPSEGKPLPKAFLWKGDGSHSAIERLCDGSLVMAPPSIHPTTGERYRFADASRSPKRIPMPSPCPAWILNAPTIDLKPALPAFVAPKRTPANVAKGPRLDRKAVLDAIPDKVGLVRSWGVQVTGGPAANGFAPCRSILREDKNPSAGIHAATGTYCEPGVGLKLSLFDLAVTLGIYGDFRDAINDIGAMHHVR